MKLLIAFFTLALLACNSNKKDTADHAHSAADTSMMQHPATAEKLFADVKFDSKYDLSCGMPLTAGLADTAHYKGKVYGFCSPECKADFKKNADSLVLSRK